MPRIIIQRCLVHIQRMCLLWLTANPSYDAGIELRQLVLVIHRIEFENDKLYWIQSLVTWEKKYREFLKEKSYKPETGRY